MSVESSSSTHNGYALSHQINTSSNLNKDYQKYTLNPYFMHPNENSTLVLVTLLLNAGNYHSWFTSIGFKIQEQAPFHQWCFAKTIK